MKKFRIIGSADVLLFPFYHYHYHLHLVLRSRMSGAVHTHHYVLIAWCIVKHRDNSPLLYSTLRGCIQKFPD
jgi:hypothetical protein